VLVSFGGEEEELRNVLAKMKLGLSDSEVRQQAATLRLPDESGNNTVLYHEADLLIKRATPPACTRFTNI
jgi:hypothetical protein